MSLNLLYGAPMTPPQVVSLLLTLNQNEEATFPILQTEQVLPTKGTCRSRQVLLMMPSPKLVFKEGYYFYEATKFL